MDTAKIAQIVSHEGEQSGSAYKITIGREDKSCPEPFIDDLKVEIRAVAE